MCFPLTSGHTHLVISFVSLSLAHPFEAAHCLDSGWSMAKLKAQPRPRLVPEQRRFSGWRRSRTARDGSSDNWGQGQEIQSMMGSIRIAIEFHTCGKNLLLISSSTNLVPPSLALVPDIIEMGPSGPLEQLMVGSGSA